ncbi:hypothetical protein [Mesobacillus foraminis]|uniref:hypothetical protein n=1 Tax=Mesobacillus foraminis TaxID=279826 RepID=UPI000EF4ADE9|nr:hypothetical protein [Mesobacillus foraminis]
MYTRFFLLLPVASILMLNTIDKTVEANSNNKPQPLEEFYPRIGYKGVDEALNEFEKHITQNVKLPLRIPSINFTHYFGRFTDLKGEENDSLEVEFYGAVC